MRLRSGNREERLAYLVENLCVRLVWERNRYLAPLHIELSTKLKEYYSNDQKPGEHIISCRATDIFYIVTKTA
jgi:hypothetical protein